MYVFVVSSTAIAELLMKWNKSGKVTVVSIQVDVPQPRAQRSPEGGGCPRGGGSATAQLWPKRGSKSVKHTVNSRAFKARKTGWDAFGMFNFLPVV